MKSQKAQVKMWNAHEVFTIFCSSASLGEISFKQIEIANGYAVNLARAWDYNKDGHKDVLYTGVGSLQLALGPG